MSIFKLNFLKRKNHGLIDLVLKNFNENILSSDLFGRLKSSLEVQSSREGVATSHPKIRLVTF